MEFINRSRELDFVQTIISEQPRTSICFSTCNATGFTSFCKKVEYLYDNKEVFPIYIDGGDKSGYTVYTSTFEKVWKKDKQLFNKCLSQYAITEPGSATRNTAAALAGIPFVGNFLGEPLKQFSESSKFIRQAAHLQESFVKLVASLSKKWEILFLIDNLQLLDNWSASLIEHIEDAELGTNYIFGQCVAKGHENNGALLLKLGSKGREIIHRSFDPPDIKFIREIAQHTGNNITNSFAKDLIYESEGNLYKILARLRGSRAADQEPLSKVQTDVLKLLHICSQPVRKTDILSLILNLPDHYLQSEDLIIRDIEKLRHTGNLFETQLPDGDTLIKLKSSSVAEAFIHSDTPGNQLYLANQVYEFYQNVWKYSLRHSKSEIALLLYRLARMTAPAEARKHAQDIIKISFALGTGGRAEQFINDVLDINHPANETEFYLGVTFHMAYRRYGTALALLNDPRFQTLRQAAYYKIAEAICLERERKYQQFNDILNRQLPIATLHEECILRVHQINAMVHTNKLKEAGDLLVAGTKTLSKAHAFPYLLRTATSIYEPRKAEPFLANAIKQFKDRGDDFGYATSLANMALLQIENGKYTEAIKTLKASKAILMIFGIHHLNILENSMGLAFLHLGSLEMAAASFNKGFALSTGEMSRLYFQINLSITDCIQGNYQDAYNRLVIFEDFVVNYPVDRVRQKYYVNMACIAIMNNLEAAKVNYLLGEMVRYPDRKYPAKTSGLAVKLRQLHTSTNRKIDLRCFSLCNLEYWYSNPLADLTMESLPGEALI